MRVAYRRREWFGGAGTGSTPPEHFEPRKSDFQHSARATVFSKYLSVLVSYKEVFE